MAKFEIGDVVRQRDNGFYHPYYNTISKGALYKVIGVDATCINLERYFERYTSSRSGHDEELNPNIRYSQKNFELVKKAIDVTEPANPNDHKFVVWTKHDSKMRPFSDEVAMKKYVENFLTTQPFSEARVFTLSQTVKREMSPITWSDV